jgi:hypothetical protein
MSPPPVVKCISSVARVGLMAAIAAIALPHLTLLACPISPQGAIGTTDCQVLALPEGNSPLEIEVADSRQLQSPPLDLDPAILEQSPVLRRWLQQIPEVEMEVRQVPAFRPRLRVSYTQFPSREQVGGWQVGLEDIFLVPGKGLAAGADYGQSGTGDLQSYGVEARYYLLPLGGYLNLAPTLGYRSLTTTTHSSTGVSLGLRLVVVPSRGGGTDLSLSQQWIAPGQIQEAGLTTVTLGYALTPHLRLGTDWQWQRSNLGQDNRWGLGLEWLL